MKHVLVLIGSPRRGETLKAAQRLEEEMGKLGPVAFEYVMLRDLALPDCLGCHACFMKGEAHCPQAAAVKEMQGRMLAADLVILASPTYNQGVTALLKKFLDYYTFHWHRPGMFGAKFFGLATGGGMFGSVFKTMRENVVSWGGSWLGSIGVPHYEALTDKYKAKLDRSFTKKVAMLARAMDKTELPRPSFGRLMWFRMWRVNAGTGLCPPDKAYWTERGWLDPKCRYYYESRINPLKNAAAGVAMGIGRQMMKSVYKEY